jgi:hypothetical protein
MVKIPVRYADIIGLNKSFLVRVNQGKRRLGVDTAIAVVEAAKAEGRDIDILELRPDLSRLIPLLCGRVETLVERVIKKRAEKRRLIKR